MCCWLWTLCHTIQHKAVLITLNLQTITIIVGLIFWKDRNVLSYEVFWWICSGVWFYIQFKLVAQAATLGKFSYLHKFKMAAGHHISISVFERFIVEQCVMPLLWHFEVYRIRFWGYFYSWRSGSRVGGKIKVKARSNLTKLKFQTTLEKVAIIAMYCHLRPPGSIAFPIYHLLWLQIWAADEPNVVPFRVAVKHHINAAQRVYEGLGQNEIATVGKNSGPVLSRLCTKVHEILGQRRRPLVLSEAVTRLSMSCFIQQIFVINSRSRQKRTNVKIFIGPQF